MLFKKKKKVLVSLYVLAGICTGCERCIKRCKMKVFSMGHMEDRDVAAVAHPEVCTGCGKCVSVCKAEAIELVAY